MAKVIHALRALICCALTLSISRLAFAETRVASLVPGAAAADTIAAGADFACALTTDGRVTCWGDNSAGSGQAIGELGRDSHDLFSPEPAYVVGLDQVVSITAGWSHACALRQNGTVWCWGVNDSGQLGDGTTKNRLLPVPVKFPDSANPKHGIVRITAGVIHTCAVDDANRVYCWGGNYWGEAGFGPETMNSNTPRLLSLTNVVSVHSGPVAYHTCAVLADGEMKCWGWNGEGELGNGSTNDVEWDPETAPSVVLPTAPVPYSTATTTVGVASVSLNEFQTCISTDAGQVYCWGENSGGRVLGNGNGNSGIYRTPQLVVSTPTNNIENITQVSAEHEETCARRGNGKLYCWGGSYGVNVVERPENDVYSIASGGWFECLFRRSTDGSENGVYCSGDNYWGELGLPSTCGTGSCDGVDYGTYQYKNTIAHGKIAGTFKYNHIGGPVVSTGTATCLRTVDGRLKCWGRNNVGQVGDNSTTNRLTATPVVSDGASNPISLGDYVQVAGGLNYNCGLKWDGTVWCWGSGGGATAHYPTQISGMTGAVQITAGSGFTCALLSTGQAKCWGSNGYGMLGNGTTTSSSVPVNVGYNGNQAVLNGAPPQQYVPLELSQLSSKLNQVCALYRGMPICWGYYLDSTYAYPTLHQNIPSPYTQLSVGGNQICGLKSSGTLSCWGANVTYQRSDADTASTLPPSTPVTVNLSDVTAVLTGTNYSCAWISMSSYPYCWGYNLRGALGDGTSGSETTRQLTVPTIAPAPHRAASGYLNSCVLGTIGQLTCWGDNYAYQGDDGVGSTTMVTTPTPAWGFACPANANEYQSPSFSDSQACTDDVCTVSLSNGANTISHPNMMSATWCSDNFCKGGNRCDSNGTCSVGADPCNSNDACHTRSCDQSQDTCVSALKNADDGNSCTNDFCDSVDGIVHVRVPEGTACSDFNVCTINDKCNAYGFCLPGTAIPLPPPPDKTGCAVVTCNTFTGVTQVNAPAGYACDDGNKCTTGDTCNGAGICTGTLKTGDSGNTCTQYICDPAMGNLNVVPQPQGTPCTGSATGCDGSGHCAPFVSSPVLPVASPLTAALGQGTVAERTALLIGTVQTKQTDASGTLIDILIDPNRQSLIRGRVLGQDGLPLPNVKVAIKGNPQYGQTLSRADGWYDLAVEGGGGLVVNYTKAEYLPLQRVAQMAWNEYVQMDDVILDKPQETTSQSIPISTLTSPMAHVGPVNASPDGSQSREAILIFPKGVVATATSTISSPQTQTLSTLNVRTHEYTRDINPVGTLLENGSSIPPGAAPGMSVPTGRLAMPGELPPASGYTYAVDLMDDAQLSDDTLEIQFTVAKPVLYLDNFLNMKVGIQVPVGSYDKDKASWSDEANGVVVQIVLIANGTVTLDVDGDGAADDNVAKIAPLFGLTNNINALNDELAALANLSVANSRIQAGKSFWRASIAHFSPWDLNHGYGPNACSDNPQGPCPGDSPGSVTSTGRGISRLKSCETTGSRIFCDSHVVGEQIPIAGTDYSLVYNSARVPGYYAERKLHVELPAQNSTNPKNRGGVTVDAWLGGLPVAAGPVASTKTSLDIVMGVPHDWAGRTINGMTNADILVTEWYFLHPIEAPASSDMEQLSFTTPSGATVGDYDRDVLKVRRWFKQNGVSVFDAGISGLGGWDLSIHHWYDKTAEVLYRGDGTNVKASGFSDNGYMVDQPIHGSELINQGPACGVTDGTQASALGAVPGNGPGDYSNSDIAVAPNGDVFLTSYSPGCVYLLSPRNCQPPSTDPTVRCTMLVAGAAPGGTPLSTASGPITTAISAKSVQFSNPVRAISIGPEGSLYIAEATTNDSTPATNSVFVHRVFPDSTDTDKSRITSISKLQTIAGTGANSISGDGGQATSAGLGSGGGYFDIDVSKDGTLYILSRDTSCTGAGVNTGYTGRLRSVTVDGVIHSLVGGGSTPFYQLSGPSSPILGNTLACYSVAQGHIAVASNGEVYTAGNYEGFVLRRDGRLEHIWSDDSVNGDSRPRDGVLATKLGAFRSNVPIFTNLTATSDGSILISDQSIAGIRRVDSAGMISTLVNGVNNMNTDSQSNPNYMISFDANHAAVPALRVNDFLAQRGPAAIAAAPNGDIYMVSSLAIGTNGPSVLRAYRRQVAPTPSCDSYVPSEDGSEVYCFDINGYHVQTFDGHLTVGGTRVSKYKFQYDTDNPNLLTGVTDANNNFTSIGRDPGAIQRNAAGTIQITPTIGSPTTVYTDSNGYAQRVTAPDGGQWYVSMSGLYGHLGLLQSLQDPGGTTHVFTYNDTGELVADGIQPAGASAQTFFQALEFSLSTPNTSNTTTRSTTHTSAEGLKTKYESTRDSGDLETRTVTAPTGEVYTTTSQADGTTTVQYPDGTRLQSIPDADDPVFPGGVAHPLKRVTLPSNISVQTTTTRDNSVLNPSGIDKYTITSGSHVTTLTYYPTSNSLVTQTPGGRQFTTAFDNSGNVVSVSEPSVAGPPFGPSFGYTSASPGGLLNRITNRGTNTTLTYGTNGNPIGYLSSVSGPYSSTDYTWTIPASSPGTQLTQDTNGLQTAMAWDPMKNLTTVQTPNNFTHNQGYDYFNGLASYSAPSGTSPDVSSFTTTYTRNNDRQVTSISQPGRNPINFVYTNGRLNYLFIGAQPMQAGNRAIDWEYVPVPAGGSTNGGGHVLSIMGPDTATSTTPPLAFGSSTPKITYTYDGFLPLTENWYLGSTVMGSVTTVYNSTDLMPTSKNISLKSGTNTFNSNVTRTFDADGLITCATGTGSSPCGTVASTDFTALYGGTSCPNGRLCQDKVGNAIEYYAYDGFGALYSQTTAGYTAPLVMTYSVRDAMGRISQKQESRSGETHAYTYTYDGFGQLTNVADFFNGTTTNVESYTYDNNGNRLTELGTPNGALVAYDAQDRLKTFTTGDSHVWQFTYADNGALLTRTDTSATTGTNGTNLTYDELGNLVRADLLAGNTVSKSIEYVVDGRGRRIGKKVGGAFTRQWIYDGQLRIVAEIATNPSNGTTTMNRFIYGSRTNTPEVMLSYATPASAPVVYRIFADHLGSPRLVVRTDGTVVMEATYKSFGMPFRVSGSLDAIPFGFAGGLYDVDTGLVRFGVRDYDPLFGRWVSKDPILFSGGQTNLYVYVGNDPANSLDPTGLRDYSAEETQMILDDAIANYNASSYPGVMVDALANNSVATVGQYDFRELYAGDTFDVSGWVMKADQFGNYFAGYVNDAAFGPIGFWATRAGGNLFALTDFRKHTFDDPEDIELMRRGAFDSMMKYRRWGGAPTKSFCGR